MKYLRISIKTSGRFELQPKRNVMWTELFFTPVWVHFTSLVNALLLLHEWKMSQWEAKIEAKNILYFKSKADDCLNQIPGDLLELTKKVKICHLWRLNFELKNSFYKVQVCWVMIVSFLYFLNPIFHLLKGAIASFASSLIHHCIDCGTNIIGKNRSSESFNRILCFSLQLDNCYRNFPDGPFFHFFSTPTNCNKD